LAYALMTLDCQSVAVAERRPAECTIHPVKPASAAAPRRIHSHSRLLPDPPLAAGELPGCVVAGGLVVAVTVTLGPGDVMTLGLGEVVTVALGEAALEDAVAVEPEVVVLRVGDKLETALWTVPPHPAARHPAARMAAGRRRLLRNRRMPDPFMRCRLTDAGQSHS
jgi:hypothetical protein